MSNPSIDNLTSADWEAYTDATYAYDNAANDSDRIFALEVQVNALMRLILHRVEWGKGASVLVPATEKKFKKNLNQRGKHEA